MRLAAARSFAEEMRKANHVVEHESAALPFRSVLVSGILADQLAKELGAEASPGAVQVGFAPDADTEIVVRVIAGEPTQEDEAIVREADRRGIDVVLVQLWPQSEWFQPYVLTPFVVECRAGEGFPVREIADRIVDASDDDKLLGARIPVLRDSIERSLVTRTVLRAALLGALKSGPARPLITFEQLRLVTRLGALDRPLGAPDEAVKARLRATAGAVFASGLVFRGVARSARRVLPARVVNGAVAAAGTWAVSRAARSLSVGPGD